MSPAIHARLKILQIDRRRWRPTAGGTRPLWSFCSVFAFFHSFHRPGSAYRRSPSGVLSQAGTKQLVRFPPTSRTLFSLASFPSENMMVVPLCYHLDVTF